MYDVIIIGAGIIGCAVARSLSRYRLNVLVVERESDIACGASKANSGILHAGYDCEPGTKKAVLNVRGTALYKTLADELDIPCRNNGSMVICLTDDDLPNLRRLYERGLKNGVPALSLVNGEEALHLEPNLNPQAKAALLAETAGVISPYEAVIAFAENAAVNGVTFLLETTVTGLSRDINGCFSVETTKGIFSTRAVVNAAGVESAAMHNQLCDKKETVYLQRGQYYLLDNTQHDLVKRTVFQLPTQLGKGVLVVPTVDYNIMLGPTAEAINDSHDTMTTGEGLDEVLKKTELTLSTIPLRDRITAFAGIRTKHESGDFVIDEPLPYFFDAIGIDSPGLSAAPAIAEEIERLVTARLQPSINTEFTAKHTGIKRFKSLPFQEQAALIRKNPAYGHVVCRCETITEGEIMDAIHRPVGARNLDAVKRRTRAQMGRCQGGFCSVRIVELLSRELGIEETDIVKNNAGSHVICKNTRS